MDFGNYQGKFSIKKKKIKNFTKIFFLWENLQKVSFYDKISYKK